MDQPYPPTTTHLPPPPPRLQHLPRTWSVQYPPPASRCGVVEVGPSPVPARQLGRRERESPCTATLSLGHAGARYPVFASDSPVSPGAANWPSKKLGEPWDLVVMERSTGTSGLRTVRGTG